MSVMDWLAKMLGLPEHFLHHHPSSQGGGVLQVPVMLAFHLTLGLGPGSKGKPFPTVLPFSVECPLSHPNHHRHHHPCSFHLCHSHGTLLFSPHPLI